MYVRQKVHKKARFDLHVNTRMLSLDCLARMRVRTRIMLAVGDNNGIDFNILRQLYHKPLRLALAHARKHHVVIHTVCAWSCTNDDG